MQEQDEEGVIQSSDVTKNVKNPAELPIFLHALANKLLPIVAFSDLGVRNAQDPLLLNYFEKIRQAARDARDLIVSVRQELQEQERKKQDVPIKPGAENE